VWLRCVNPLDDRFAAVGQIDIWHAGRKSGGVFGAPSMKAAEPMLGSIIVDFEVIGYGFTILTVTEDQLIERLFKMEILHVTTETTSRLSLPGGSCLKSSGAFRRLFKPFQKVEAHFKAP
jgi:hypothetical protein